MSCDCELLSLLEKKCIQKLLLTKNNDGDTPLHIASEYWFVFSCTINIIRCDHSKIKNKNFTIEIGIEIEISN